MTSAMRELSNFIDEFELVDLPRGMGCKGGGVVVTLGVEGMVARLDHFIFFGDWEELVSRPMQHLQLRPISNHCPVFLYYEGEKRPKPV